VSGPLSSGFLTGDEEVRGDVGEGGELGFEEVHVDVDASVGLGAGEEGGEDGGFGVEAGGQITARRRGMSAGEGRRNREERERA
jgi:hypothetical protein